MSLTHQQARRLFSEARRIYDVACVAFERTDGTLDSAPILQRSLYAASGLLLRLHGAPCEGYGATVREAQRINAQVRLLDEDISVPLLALGEVSARQVAIGADDPELAALRQRYREVYLWAPDLLRALEATIHRRFSAVPTFFARDSWRVPIRAFIATRAALLLIGYVGLRIAPAKSPSSTAFPLNRWLEPWIRWDSAWFYSIDVRGYDTVGTGHSSNVVFFPLFPALADVGSWPLRLFTDRETAYYEAALLVAYGAFLLALVGVRRLGALLLGPGAAERGTWLLALFPFSFFFSAPYPQSLFCALSVWSVTLALEAKWLQAALLASLAGVTYQHGLILPLVLATLYARASEHPGATRPPLSQVLGVASMAPVALMTYFGWRYHDPFVFVREYFGPWGRHVGLAHWTDAARFLVNDPPSSEGLPFMWNVVLVPVVAILVVAVWRRLGPANALFCIAPALVGVFVTVGGFGRFVATAFPLFLWLGWRVRDRKAFAVLCGVFAPTLAYFTYAFCHAGPVGGP
jgi:hypothetical protein